MLSIRMKTKTKDFIQNLFHDIEDEEKAGDLLEEALPGMLFFGSMDSKAHWMKR